MITSDLRGRTSTRLDVRCGRLWTAPGRPRICTKISSFHAARELRERERFGIRLVVELLPIMGEVHVSVAGEYEVNEGDDV